MQKRRRSPRYHARLVAMAVVGVVVAAVLVAVGRLDWAASLGWAAACLVYVVTAYPLLRADAATTRRTASHEDPRRTVSDVLLVFAAVASVVALVVLLVGAGQASGTSKIVAAILGVVSVAVSWALVQTLFTLRYAELYYSGEPGGIDFNNDKEQPRYADFAYFAVTVGMTYQVSDTTITATAIRSTTLRHALLSFFFGTVVIASVVNLVAGLG